MNAAAKTTVLVLPGMDGTGELLSTFADRLLMRRPIQVISYPASERLDYSGLANFVAERAPATPFVILGESFSGPVAIEIAATDRRVVGLVLVSSFVRHPMPRLFAPLASLLSVRFVPVGIITAMLLGSSATAEFRERVRKVLTNVPPDIIRFRASAVLRVDKRSKLREIECPMLCLYGRLDRLIGQRHLREIALIQPRCQVRWLDAPHMLLEAQPDAAADAIDQFCSQLD